MKPGIYFISGKSSYGIPSWESVMRRKAKHAKRKKKKNITVVIQNS